MIDSLFVVVYCPPLLTYILYYNLTFSTYTNKQSQSTRYKYTYNIEYFGVKQKQRYPPCFDRIPLSVLSIPINTPSSSIFITSHRIGNFRYVIQFFSIVKRRYHLAVPTIDEETTTILTCSIDGSHQCFIHP
jgi:hypothetical protein